MSALTLAELGRFLTDHYTRDVLRVETRQRYDAESERDDLGRYLAGEPAPAGAGDTPWTRQLRAHVAAGRSWRVLHAVRQPLSDYVRYECEWGYVHNGAAGQAIRIADLTDAHEQLGDLLVVDGVHVFRYRYDGADRFAEAEQVADRNDVGECVALLEQMWSVAQPFTGWWAAHPQYHRGARAA